MWFRFESIDEKHDLIGQSGKPYSGFVVSGVKLGYQDTPDQPYQKVLFSNQACTIIEHGITRPGMSIVQFFQKAAKPGDVFDIKSEREGKFWKWISISKREDNNPTYEPLTDEQVNQYKMAQAAQAPMNVNNIRPQSAAPALPSYFTE